MPGMLLSKTTMLTASNIHTDARSCHASFMLLVMVRFHSRPRKPFVANPKCFSQPRCMGCNMLDEQRVLFARVDAGARRMPCCAHSVTKVSPAPVTREKSGACCWLVESAAYAVS